MIDSEVLIKKTTKKQHRVRTTCESCERYKPRYSAMVGYEYGECVGMEAKSKICPPMPKYVYATSLVCDRYVCRGGDDDGR